MGECCEESLPESLPKSLVDENSEAGVNGFREEQLKSYFKFETCENKKVCQFDNEVASVKLRGNSPRRGYVGRSLRLVLLGVMWTIFLAWISLLVIHPTSFYQRYVEKPLNAITEATYYGIGGVTVLLYCVPILTIALLGTIYLRIYKNNNDRETKLTKPRISLWTCPALVDGLLGVVSFAELMFIVLLVLYTAWFLWSYLRRDFGMFDEFHRWQFKLAIASVRLGKLGLILLGFLFLPVSRGSVLLRLIDIPFDHAVKYHVWLGHFMMVVFTVHGLTYVIIWTTEGRLASEMVTWQKIGIANLPGVIALVSGWMIWLTSLHQVRQHFFEIFFYTHQLYAIFIIFMALHIGDFILGIAIAGIFLFLLDRFLRFCQSRRAVTVLSARLLPCDAIELVIAKHPSIQYYALSFIFLNIPALSWFQWHPFSVSSSPYDGKHHVSILIKPLGSWTHKLRQCISAADEHLQGKHSCSFGIPIGVEGPYGHESNYYLRYTNLILIAGGIGISPFVAIIRDLLHRYKMDDADLPRRVLLILAVKKSKETCILDLIHPESIEPDYASKLDLDVRTYVTQESLPNTEYGQENVVGKATYSDCTSTAISVVVGTNSNFWYGMCTVSCIIGYIIFSSLIGKYLIYAADKGSYHIVSWSLRGGYVAFSMILAILLFGGITVFFWKLYGGELTKDIKFRPMDLEEERQPFLHPTDQPLFDTEAHSRLVQPSNTCYGCRPNFQELLQEVSKNWEGSNIGVLVCGPQQLQTSVATWCRIYNFKNLRTKRVAFHFHSLSFDF